MAVIIEDPFSDDPIGEAETRRRRRRIRRHEHEADLSRRRVQQTLRSRLRAGLPIDTDQSPVEQGGGPEANQPLEMLRQLVEIGQEALETLREIKEKLPGVGIYGD